jgi:hypothetical protein
MTWTALMPYEVWDTVVCAPTLVTRCVGLAKARRIARDVRTYYTDWCGLQPAYVDLSVYITEADLDHLGDPPEA